MCNHIDGDKNKCCGCQACEDICPKGCIAFRTDEEGFLYPAVDESVCIRCGLCRKVCPSNYKDFIDERNVDIYVARNHSNEVVKHSSSGGAFTTICQHWIGKDAVVYGAGFDENLKLTHERATTWRECEKFRKSKYLQSDLNHSYSKVEKDLQNGKRVLFSGTPCQCAALKEYLQLHRIKQENLLLVNILCHGVPAQKLFDMHKEELEKRNGKLQAYIFRSKKPIKGCVNSRSAELIFQSGKHQLVDMSSDAFLKGFYERLFIRPACANCKFAQRNRTGDITLADAWQIEKTIPEWNSLEGISLIFINTAKGKAILEGITGKLEIRKSSMEWAVSVQDVLSEPTKMHPRRSEFFKLLPVYGFSKAVSKATHRTILQRAKSRLGRMIKRLAALQSKGVG